MNLMSRLSADARHRRRAREVRAELRREQRAQEKRARLVNPGYDELSDPVFITVILLAVFVLVIDIRGDFSVSDLQGWLRVAVATVKGWA